MARLSVVIVTFNSRGDIDACLDALARHPAPLDMDVTVVDNGSTDGTAAHVRAAWPAAQVVATGNRGFAAGCNTGIRATAGELILLLNPDTRVRPGALAALAGTLEATPAAAAAGPRIVGEDGRAELSFGAMLSPLAELRQRTLVRAQARRTPLLAGYVERLTRRAGPVDWVSGACLLVRRRDAEAVGLLDERYFLYEEDVDFCAALRARGRLVLFEPAAEVEHARGRSAAGDPAAAARAYHASHLAFYRKHHPGWAPLLRLWLSARGYDL